MTERCITYFGYGSLVNRATRPADEQALPARLYGWQRVWGHRVQQSGESNSGLRPACCSLSVEKCEGDNQAFIDGVIVRIPLVNLPVLDQREVGYDRVQLPASDFDLPESCSVDGIHVYVSAKTHSIRPNAQHPILQSYIDCVLAGYCSIYGQTGMQQFVDSTSGWGGFIEKDRHKPQYPRAVAVPQNQLNLFDEVVSQRCLSADSDASS